ncbi:MAG: hypothetical protein ABWY20_20250 [Mycobacterium sp.]
MTVTATPTLTVGGEVVPLSTATALSIPSWGRAGPLEQPTPATASVSVLDRSPRATFARRTDLIGQPVVLGWSIAGGGSGVNFRGRITDAVAVPHRAGAPAGGGFRVQLSASSREVDLANYLAPAGTVWPAESPAARLSRILALLPAGLLAGGVTLPADPALVVTTVAQQDVSNQSALELLRILFASLAAAPMTYVPATDGVFAAFRHRHTYQDTLGTTPSVKLIPSPADATRRIPAGYLSELHLDAGKTQYAGALRQPIDARITRVEVSYLDSSAAYEQRTASAATVDTPLEATIGRRVLSIGTILPTATLAATLAAMWADIANREARVPRLDTVGVSTDLQPFTDEAHAGVLLAGAEQLAHVFMRGSWLPQLRTSPLVAFAGGGISYAGGHWALELNPVPVVIDPAPKAWAPITPRAAVGTGLRLRDFDRSVTVGDLGFIDALAAPPAPYPGNGLNQP